MAVHNLHTISATIQGIAGAGTVYTQGFEASVDAWAATTATFVSSTAQHHTGAQSALWTGAGGADPAKRTISGLTIGLSYTLSAWVRLSSGSPLVSLTESAGTFLTSPVAATTTWQKLTVTFTAKSTSYVLELLTYSASASATYWDDVLLVQNDYVLDVKSGSITLDDTWSPYCQVSLTCVAPADPVLELIDPRLTQRVTVVVTESFGVGTQWNPVAQPPVTRTFNLTLRGRSVSAVAGEMTVTAASDERLLQDFTKIITATERLYGLSVRAAVTYALGKIGATLVSGTDDFTLTAKPLEPAWTNLHPNPNATTATTGFATGGANATVSRQTGLVGGPVAAVTTFFRTAWTGASGSGAGGFFYSGSPTISITPALQYSYGVWVRSNVNQTITLNVQWTGTSPNTIGSDHVLLAGVWTWVEETFTAIAASTVAAVYVYPKAGFQWVSGNTFDSLGWVFVLGGTVPDSFDGTNVGNRDANLYTIAWTGTANASSSTLTNLLNSDSMIWLPGVTAWDWVSPLVQAGNLYLFCDEARNWNLVKSVSVPGIVSLSSSTGLTDAVDDIDLSDNSDFFTAVVIQYNAPADPLTGLTPAPQYDVAGVAGPTLNVVYDATVYPGPGAASAILARATGKGRTFDITAESQYTTTPGMQISISIPNGTNQGGAVSSVTWSFPDATMSIGSTGLVSIPPGAWLLAVGPWTAATGSWTAATGTN